MKTSKNLTLILAAKLEYSGSTKTHFGILGNRLNKMQTAVKILKVIFSGSQNCCHSYFLPCTFYFLGRNVDINAPKCPIFPRFLNLNCHFKSKREG